MIRQPSREVSDGLGDFGIVVFITPANGKHRRKVMRQAEPRRVSPRRIHSLIRMPRRRLRCLTGSVGLATLPNNIAAPAHRSEGRAAQDMAASGMGTGFRLHRVTPRLISTS